MCLEYQTYDGGVICLTDQTHKGVNLSGSACAGRTRHAVDHSTACRDEGGSADRKKRSARSSGSKKREATTPSRKQIHDTLNARYLARLQARFIPDDKPEFSYGRANRLWNARLGKGDTCEKLLKLIDMAFDAPDGHFFAKADGDFGAFQKCFNTWLRVADDGGWSASQLDPQAAKVEAEFEAASRQYAESGIEEQIAAQEAGA